MNLGKISDYWGRQFIKMRADSHYWMNNLIVQNYVYTLMTGENKHWLSWLLDSYFKDKKFKSSLSICCGDGAHELILAKSKKIEFVHGIDISLGAINQAKDSFKKSLIKDDAYFFEVKDANKITASDFNRKYDIIFSTGALHHVEALENIINAIKNILDTNGYFIIVEYIGPRKFQWADRQIAVINDILVNIDKNYLRNPGLKFKKPTVDEMDKIDPSEAIRSDDIYKIIKDNFHIEYERMYNGTIIHQLYPQLNSNLANKKDFDSILNLILYLENKLISCGFLQSDFVFLITRKK